MIRDTKTTDVKTNLINATQAAVELGIFGVPAFRIDGQLFWGDDRIAELIRYAQGQRIDETLLNRILAREASA